MDGSQVLMEQGSNFQPTKKIFHCLIEYLGLFQIWEVTGIWNDLELGFLNRGIEESWYVVEVNIIR